MFPKAHKEKDHWSNIIVLDYGDVVYRYAPITTLKSLDSVHHAALRFITGDPYNTHHCILYEKVGWSSLSVHQETKWLLFIYKALTGHMPSYITEMLSVNNAVYQTRSSDWITLQVPRAFTELGKSAFSYSTSSWNSLQETLKLRSLVSHEHFKLLVSNHLHTACNCFIWFYLIFNMTFGMF